MTARNIIVIEPMRQDIDVSGARDHGGKLVYLFGANGHRRPPVWSDEFLEEALMRLYEIDYDPKKDLLLLAGGMVAVCRLLSRLVHRHGNIPSLVFDSHLQAYKQMEMGT